MVDINNVGSISQALFAKGDPDFDDKKAAQWQATQVSTISIMNCLGRLAIGMLLDLFAASNVLILCRHDSRFYKEQAAATSVILHIACNSIIRPLAGGGLFNRRGQELVEG